MFFLVNFLRWLLQLGPGSARSPVQRGSVTQWGTNSPTGQRPRAPTSVGVCSLIPRVPTRTSPWIAALATLQFTSTNHTTSPVAVYYEHGRGRGPGTSSEAQGRRRW